MNIGIPREVKDNENRVSMTPGGVESLRRHDHEVLVEEGAGLGSGITDREFEAAGAKIVDVDAAWNADLVIKVKEPVESEYKYLRQDLMLFTYLHLAANRQLTEKLLETGVTGVAYETVQLPDGSLPLLTPMSEVAGRMATQEGAHYLEKFQGGRGILLGGVPGVKPASVVIIGAGVVGTNSARIAVGMGALVTMIDISHAKLQYLDDIYHGRIVTLNSTEPNIRQAALDADLIIGAVLIPGGKAPTLISRGIVKRMKEGSVIIDVAVDQGGCVETIKPTTHADPTYLVDGVVHYGVANMPGAVPRTSTFALVNVTMPYALALADKGLDAMRDDPVLAKGLNTHKGNLTYKAVAEAFDMDYVDPSTYLS
jgi:alanine dehydrogenase